MDTDKRAVVAITPDGDGSRGEGLPMGAPLIPRKYLSSATSGITVEVKPGDNEPLALELTDD